jgi:hypothetical protein
LASSTCLPAYLALPGIQRRRAHSHLPRHLRGLPAAGHLLHRRDDLLLLCRLFVLVLFSFQNSRTPIMIGGVFGGQVNYVKSSESHFLHTFIHCLSNLERKTALSDKPEGNLALTRLQIGLSLESIRTDSTILGSFVGNTATVKLDSAQGAVGLFWLSKSWVAITLLPCPVRWRFSRTRRCSERPTYRITWPPVLFLMPIA